jgi:hypothetical protein
MKDSTVRTGRLGEEDQVRRRRGAGSGRVDLQAPGDRRQLQPDAEEGQRRLGRDEPPM